MLWRFHSNLSLASFLGQLSNSINVQKVSQRIQNLFKHQRCCFCGCFLAVKAFNFIRKRTPSLMFDSKYTQLLKNEVPNASIILAKMLTGLFLYPLKTSEELWFSDIFLGYGNRPSLGSILNTLQCIIYYLNSFKTEVPIIQKPVIFIIICFYWYPNIYQHFLYSVQRQLNQHFEFATQVC